MRLLQGNSDFLINLMSSSDEQLDDSPPDSVRSLASVPKAVVGRLSLYLRELQIFLRQGSETVSSIQLGKVLGFTDAQVRKDLAYFGQFGYPGIGYKCAELVGEIKKIYADIETARKNLRDIELNMALFKEKKEGSDLLSHQLAVPSALKDFTSLFGMVKGVSPSLSPPTNL